MNTHKYKDMRHEDAERYLDLCDDIMDAEEEHEICCADKCSLCDEFTCRLCGAIGYREIMQVKKDKEELELRYPIECADLRVRFGL